MPTLVQGRNWDELSPRGKVLMIFRVIVQIILGIAQLTLLVAALRDIRRRPADQIRGSKRLWTMISFVNWVGPIAYFMFGRLDRATE